MVDKMVENYIHKFTGHTPDQLKHQITKTMDSLSQRLACLYMETVRSRKSQEAAFGRMPLGRPNAETGLFEDDPRLMPRSLTTAPHWYEDEGSGVLEEKTIDLEGDLQRCPSSGFYCNLGTDEFKVVVEYADKTRTATHTVPAGVSIPITGFVSKIIIYPVGGNPARYQVKAE